ncbi:integrase, catalytic region, zinc finger, CCHC-type containing protein, partial [Tanacetum coccineum]
KNKKNRVAKTECNAYVMQSVLNANSKSVCAICNECLFNANHDKCVLDYVHDVNVLSKSKPAMRKHKKQIWKPMGKVYTEIGYKWKPAGRTFTIVGNKYPLTRFTSTKVVQILLWYLDSGCSKHMTENRSQLTNFVKKLIGTVKFGNDQIAKIMGYSDYQTGNVTISRVKFLRSKDEALEFIIKFLKMIQVRLNATVRNIRTDNSIEFVNQTLRSYYEDVGISHETSVVSTPQQNDVVERRNRILVEVVYTMLIYAKAPLFLWAEAVAIACYTQNHSLIRLRHGKTPHELLHDRKPDLSSLYVFGALCYPTNDSEDLGKLKAKDDVDFDELTTMASEQSSSRPALHEMTPGTLS